MPRYWGYEYAPYGYILVEDIDPDECDLVGPNGECYVRVDSDVELLGSVTVDKPTLRGAPVQEQIYALQVAAARTGNPALIQAGKNLQTELSSWWATFVTSGIKSRAADLGDAIAKYTGGPNPLDASPMAGGVSSAQQKQLFDSGITGKLGLASADVAETFSDRAREAREAADKIAAGAKRTATIVAVVGAVLGVAAVGVVGTAVYKRVRG